MAEVIDKEVLLDILLNEGCLIDATMTNPDFSEYESTKVISRCRNYSVLMDTSGEELPRKSLEKDLVQLGMHDLIGVIPYQESHVYSSNEIDEEE